MGATGMKAARKFVGEIELCNKKLIGNVE